jgi:hypothetical protein
MLLYDVQIRAYKAASAENVCFNFKILMHTTCSSLAKPL